MQAQHLDNRIHTQERERVPSRNGFGDGLKLAADRDPNVVALSADLTGSTRVGTFAEAYPSRFIQVGVAEQNMASTASGLAAMGKVPFIASYAMFSPGRNWEQIRTTIAYNNQNVKIAGAHAGVSVGPDGATHQALEDIALMRSMPNMVVIAPADAHEARKATLQAALTRTPTYIRLGRNATPLVTTEESPFAIGQASEWYSKHTGRERSVGIVVTGTLAYHALIAAQKLEAAHDLGVSVLHMATIKPLDANSLETFAAAHDALITLEEHQVHGGLYSAVAEHLAKTQPTRIHPLAVMDRFGQSGEPDELLHEYGLDANAVEAAVKQVAGLDSNDKN